MTSFNKQRHVALSLLVILTLLSNGCATTIVTHGDLPDIDLQSIPCDVKRSVTIRPFWWVDFHLHNKREVSKLARSAEFDNIVLNIARQSKCFSEVKIASLPAEGLDFSNSMEENSKTGQEKAQEYLNSTFDKTNHSDLWIDLYAYREQSPASSLIIVPYTLWFMVHIVSIGLIPVWIPESMLIKAAVRDHEGNIVSKFDVANSASQWTWSPFIFGPGKTSFDAEKESAHLKNSLFHLVQQTSNVKLSATRP